MGYTLFLVLIILINVFSVAILVRNFFAYRFRMRTLEKVSNSSRVDINNHIYDFEWRYDTFTSVPYNAMILQFWRPLTVEEWYDSDDFTKPTTI